MHYQLSGKQEYCNNTCIPSFRRKGENPPCETCDNKIPYLLSTNFEAWFLYSKIQTQYTYAMGYPVALDYNVLFKIAHLYCIEVTPAIFDKIKLLESEYIKYVQEEAADKK